MNGERVEIRLLGPVEVSAGDLTLGYGRPQQGVALAVLAERAGRPVPVAALVRDVWGDPAPPRAARLLSTLISRIRRMLEQACTGGGAAARVGRRAGGYVLEVDPDRIDLHRFRRMVARAGAAGHTPGDRAGLLRDALTLWRGDALAGLPGPWAEQSRATWDQQRVAALLAWADAELEVGDPSTVVEVLTPEVARQQLVEPLVAALMRALAATGRSAEALASYERVRAHLAERLGADPGALLRAVHSAVLRSEVTVLSGLGATAVPAPAGTPPRTPPAQLPADVSGFTGRGAELARLDALLPDTERPGTAVVIAAVCGTAGVGKTALAVHWGHRVRERFPDGELYLDLRGYDPDQPMAPADALAMLLDGLGVTGADVPLDVAARAARYRSELANRRMLLVLDNAASVEQLRPLLPGTASCMAVVTSRDSLAGLVAMHGATRVDLDRMPAAEAHALLRRIIGTRADAEPDAVAMLADRCARLPLALRVAAELATSRAETNLAGLAGELTAVQNRLDLLDAGGDPRAAMRSVFSWSVRHLPPPAAHAFRLLGLHPGTDLDVSAVAALTGTDPATAGRIVGGLARVHLVQVLANGRYGMHDLLRAYAAELAADHDTDDERRAACQRLLDAYLAGATAAMDVLYPAESHQRPRPDPPAPRHAVADPADARRWLDAERSNLVATAAFAATHGWPAYTVHLSTTLHRYLEGGHYTEALDLHAHAHRAAHLVGDPAAQGWALYGLGTTHLRLDNYGPAADHLRQAIARFRDARDPGGQARALNNLGNVEALRGTYDAAAGHHREALALSRSIDDASGQARALDGLGNVEQRRGRHDAAVGHLRRALDLYRRAGNQFGEANAANNLGLAEQRTGSHGTAVEHLEHGLALFRRFGHRAGEAAALDNLGILHNGLGQPHRATAYFTRALALYREMNDREGQTWALNGIGEAAQAAGRPSAALAHHADALDIATAIGARAQQARARTGLAHAHRAMGDVDRAAGEFRRALAIHTEIGSDDADAVRAELTALGHAER